MTLEVSLATESDLAALATIQALSFTTGIGHILTGPPTPANIADLTSLRHDDLSKPTIHLVKVTDKATNTIIAGAKWEIYPTGNTPSQLAALYDTVPAIYSPPNGEKKHIYPIISYLFQHKRELIGTQPVAFLELLFTHPDHHRRGAGKLLVRWGTQKADELGIKAYLESTVEGRALYAREGFVPVKETRFDMGEVFGRPDMGVDFNCIMIREPVVRVEA